MAKHKKEALGMNLKIKW